ncbi:hypothetical protein KF707_18265 [Candidatus Obscuribacterales bacterium]|nr:hypothetical protein [Candidatus Obscuribacterales bacterium]
MQSREDRTIKRVFVLIMAFLMVGTATIVAQPEAGARNQNRLDRPRGRDRGDDGASEVENFSSDPNRPNQFEQYNKGQGNPNSDFNIGIRKDVIDDGADGLQGGVGQQGTAPLSGGAGQQGLNGGVGQTKLNVNVDDFQMQTPSYEKRKPLNASTTTFAPLVGGITQTDVQRLEQRDVVLIIDRSFSMGKMDCPPATAMGRAAGALGFGQSRWDWCRDQTRGLANVTSSFNRGVKIMMFSRGFEVFPDVNMNQVPSLFQRYQPNPLQGTDMVDPLRAVIGDYLKRRSRGQNPRPLAVAVIFDGLTRKGTLPLLSNALVDATKYMRDPDEIKITIFIVGNRGPRALEPTFEMARQLRRNGARYNILKVVPFDQVQRVGLAKSLADTLRPDQ